MPWQLAITISTLAITATSLIKRHHSQKSLAPASFPPAISFVLGVAPLGIIAGLFLPHHVHWTGWLVLLLIIIASATAIGNWLAFLAVKQLSATRFTLIARAQSIMIIAMGWLILDERLNIHELIGAIFLITAAVLAIAAPEKLHKSKQILHSRAIILALVACFFGAVGLVTEKAALGHLEIGAYLMFGYPIQSAGIALLALKDVNKSSLRNLTKTEIKWSSLMGLANGFGGVFYVAALVGSNNISLITAIGAIGLPLLALGARIILKEKENQKLLWASLTLGFIGLLIGAMR
ncbi:MAG TPA: EamA family transporter [Candidatus Saccharimonadales bacterium]|nr:EamA family transporter [Candidatus Saccharimonadales bacterium]